MSLRAARLLMIGLAAACGALALMLLVQLAGFGRGYGWLADEDGVSSLNVGTIDRTPFSLPPETTYSAVAARPLFNDDRLPTPISDSVEAEPAAPPVPLNISLTGVILTSKVRLAMIQDNARNQPLALKVGMPLEGDQSQWTLVEINARSAIFENPASERSEVALETSAVPLPAVAPAPAIQQPAPPKQTTKPGQPQPIGQATAVAPLPGEQGAINANEDLVKRIEERRRQMREEAEKLRQQPNSAEQALQPATDKKE